MPTEFEIYKACRRGMRETAENAFGRYKSHVARGTMPYNWKPEKTLGHGDVYRTRNHEGEKVTFLIGIYDDPDGGFPWANSDGHGPVTDWTTRDKLPGERVLNRDGRSKRYYDYQEATKQALRDSWGLSEKALQELETELGRKPTKRQIAKRAVDRDFKFLKDWCDDQWRYVGVAVFLLPKEGIPYCMKTIADSEPFPFYENVALWGIESCSEQFIQEVIHESISQLR